MMYEDIKSTDSPRSSIRSTDSPRSSIRSSEFFETDLEIGKQADTLQRQSHRLSNFLREQTEIHAFDPLNPPSKENVVENETSGLQYWQHEISTAAEHGGDYVQRYRTAIRAAIGSFLTFAVVVFPDQHALGAVWIGNIFMHSSLQDSVGASLTSAITFGNSIVLTTMFSWPVSYFISTLPLTQACILLPFIVFIMSFLIMSSPQIKSRNLMILVMYIVVASPVRENIMWWEPLGWVATYLIGLAIAVLMNVLVPNFAIRSTSTLLKRLQKDLTMLFLENKTYGDYNGTTPVVAKRAIASIELLHTRICSTVQKLKGKLPAAETELHYSCRSKAAKDLNEWVTYIETLLKPLLMFRTSLTQRVLGEEHSVYCETLREAKKILSDEISPSMDRLMDAMIAAVGICDAWADPSSSRVVLPDIQGELQIALHECRQAFHRGVKEATLKLEENSVTNLPNFAHLTRRMAAFSALFDIADSLVDYLEKHSWEAEVLKLERAQREEGCFCDYIVSCWSSLLNFVSANWLWHKADPFRLALKTSIGMFLASLFLSVPFLWNISKPFGVWPGLTVASVNLGKTGSSFHKASDRLFGTLLAAAYALLANDLFPGNKDCFKIPEIAVFTFVVIYLRDADHAYKHTYAATSIGSMLYGSIKNDFNIAGYVPKRIELIFVGVAIFTLTELLLFPRSSRKMVESLGFQFFLDLQGFFSEAVVCTKRMENCVKQESEKHHICLPDDRECSGIDPFHLQKLHEWHGELKAKSSKFSQELDSALEEPNIGLYSALAPESFRGLAREQANCEMYLGMLLGLLKKLGDYCTCEEEGQLVREMKGPYLYHNFLVDISKTFDDICEWLQAVFPDSRLRSQQGNSVKAVTAAASFRTLEEVRLTIIAKWSDKYHEFVTHTGFENADPVAITTMGITTTLILELCNRLQKAGRHVESITYQFPAT